MKLTNVTGVHDAIYNYLNNDAYSRGEADISVTGLLDSPRVGALTALHEDEITEDVADMSRILIGKAVHDALAGHGKGEFDDKRRLFMTVETELGSLVVSGQTDVAILEPDGTYTIMDYKSGRMKHEHAQQLNIYRALFEANNLRVGALRVWRIDGGWTPYVKSDEQHSIYPIDVEMWDLDETFDFIAERVLIHQKARIDLPLCTDEERWVEPDKYAVVKVGNTRAVKGGVFNTEEEAEQKADELTEETGTGHVVELRPGDPTPKRCWLWKCRVREYCSQYLSERDS